MESKIKDIKLDYRSILFILKTSLLDKNENVKVATLEMLGAIGRVEVFPIAALAMKDKSPRIRATTVQVLGNIKDKAAIPHLLNALEDDSPIVRAFAAKGLGKTGSETVTQKLISFLKTENEEIARIAISSAIGKMGLTVSVKPLMEILDDEKADDSLKYIASLSLSLITGKIANPSAMIFRLRDSYGKYSPRYLFDLNPFGDFARISYLSFLIDNEYPGNNYEILEKLNEIKNLEAEELLLTLMEDESAGLREKAAQALVMSFYMTYGDDFNKEIIELMDTIDKRKLVCLVNAVRIYDPQLSHTFFFNMTEEDSRLKSTSPDPLKTRKTEAISLFLNTLSKYDKNKEKSPVGNHPNSEEMIIRCLATLLHDEDKYLRKLTANILAEIESESLEKYLKVYIEDENNDPEIKRLFLSTLLKKNHLTGKPLFEILADFFLEDYNRARFKIEKSMDKANRKKLLAPIDKAIKSSNPVTGDAAILARIKIDPNEFFLLEHINNPNTKVRRKITRALGETRNNEMLPFLTEALDDEDPKVSIIAANYLFKMGQIRHTEKTVEMLNRLKIDELLDLKLYPGFYTNNPNLIKPLIKASKKANKRTFLHIVDILREMGKSIRDDRFFVERIV